LSGTRNALFDPTVVGQAPQNQLAPQPTWADAASWHGQNLSDTWSAMQQPQTWVDAARQYGNAMLMGSIAPGGNVTLFHGTSPEGLARIKETGLINGPVFLSPKKGAAFDYAGGGPVVEVKVPKSELKIDFDLPGGQLLDVKSANGYSGKDGWTIEDYLDAGHSVGIERHLPVEGAKFHEPD